MPDKSDDNRTQPQPRRMRFWVVLGVAGALIVLAICSLPHWIDESVRQGKIDYTRRQMTEVKAGTKTDIFDHAPEMIAELVTDRECADRLGAITIGEFTGPRIGDERFRDLKRLPHLSVVHIEYVGNADALIANLEGMASLEELSFHRAHLSAEGLQRLASFPRLTRLTLDDADDGVLDCIKNLSKIETHGVYDSSITAQGIASVKSMSQVTELRLGRVTISDAEELTLAQMPRLRVLDLTDANVSGEVAKKLQAALPNCAVEWTPRNASAQRNEGNHQ